jgi:hypothetical protein
MSMVTDRMIGEYLGFNMYANDFGMYYYSAYDPESGTFKQHSFDDIEDMKDSIKERHEPKS